MKNLRLIKFTIVALIITLHASAQFDEAKIEFESEIHDFGAINESDGPVTHEFSFVNNGYVPLIISGVRTSCGCTTPKWTQEPVIPGNTGTISVRFNPKSRPGPFSKSITVKSNAEKSVVVLKIKGTVKSGAAVGSINKKINIIKSTYKNKIGDLSLKNPHIAFNDIVKGETRKKVINIANSSGKNPIKVSFSSIPAFLKIDIKPEILEPAQEGTIEITFNSALNNSWDRIIQRLHVLVNDESPQNNVLTVTAIIHEDFSKLTPEELKKAPKAEFDSKTFNYGTIKQGKSLEHNFVLKNAGESDLIIRRVWASCGCTVVTPKKQVVQPGRATQIKSTFNSNGRSGDQKKMITVITNDPKNPKTILWLEGIVSPE